MENRHGNFSESRRSLDVGFDLAYFHHPGSVVQKSRRTIWQKGLNAILFFGAGGLLIGLLSQMTGIYQALGFITHARDISLGIVAEGLHVSLIGPIVGMVLFVFSALIWLVLRSKYKSLVFSKNRIAV